MINIVNLEGSIFKTVEEFNKAFPEPDKKGFATVGSGKGEKKVKYNKKAITMRRAILRRIKAVSGDSSDLRGMIKDA